MEPGRGRGIGDIRSSFFVLRSSFFGLRCSLFVVRGPWFVVRGPEAELEIRYCAAERRERIEACEIFVLRCPFFVVRDPQSVFHCSLLRQGSVQAVTLHLRHAPAFPAVRVERRKGRRSLLERQICLSRRQAPSPFRSSALERDLKERGIARGMQIAVRVMPQRGKGDFQLLCAFQTRLSRILIKNSAAGAAHLP